RRSEQASATRAGGLLAGARDRRAGGDRLEAADVPAAARRSRGLDAHVAEVARAAVRTAHERGIHEQPRADTGPDLDEDEVGDVAGDAARMLADRHQVDVVVDEDRTGDKLRERVPDGEVVPAGH